ncbi:alpha/beta fold hydrolase [Bradyrhizobium erythrophlei]|uniref:alpha/beta fold hydrolase n=1 Tax=Bradyrhizobium erythrophlei TaxID=1437360 RepID=UPI0035E646AA
MLEEFTFGSFHLNKRRRLLLRNGTPVSLGSRAIDILCELVAAQGELLTKNDLMARVWPNSVVEENNLQVHISALRKVLGEQAEGRSWLQTVPGRGYRFAGAFDGELLRRSTLTAAAPNQDVMFCRAYDGVSLAVASIGQGPPLVRTGMWMTHVEYDWSTSIWGPLLTRLAQHCRVIRYDQRGNGLSDWDIPPISFQNAVEDLEVVVDASKLERFALLGMSQGVATAIAYAAKHPDRISRLILTGGYTKGWRARGVPDQIARGEAFQTLAQIGWGQDNPAFRQLFTSLAIPDGTHIEMQAFNELQRRSSSPENAARLIAMLGAVDVTEQLKQVAVPTLVMHSRDDAWIPCEQGRAIAAAIPNARFVSIASKNHVVMSHEPEWERYIKELLDFLPVGSETPAKPA